ncbi:alpha/beta hydrolase family protein [Woodsholea maritima]|uniref:alpha/beta hydrolase family protein n=1 Tax=Woodsholea maritima TaxID=240237 RepID=UPI0003732439|nr:prolyl oligopeptidase family serine peptidase [Woodsholea maritima]
MKSLKIWASAIAVALAGTASAMGQGDLIPLDYFAVREAMQQAQVSPDGKYLALMRIASKEGDPYIEIYETNNLQSDPIRLNADPMEYTSLAWVSDDRLLISARQRMGRRIEGFNRGVFRSRITGYDISEGEFVEFGDNVGIANILPHEPDTILISVPLTTGSATEDDPFAAFRPRAYYRLNLETGQRRLVLRGNERIATASFDDEGNPRAARGYDAATRESVYYYRKPGDEQWQEAHRQDTFDYRTFDFAAFDTQDENLAYVIANNSADLAGLWEFDLQSGEIGELIFRPQRSDVSRLLFHHNQWAGLGDEIAGVQYFGRKDLTAWIDPNEQALYQALEQAIPNSHDLRITSASRDDTKLVVFNQGPRDPGSFYLFFDGQLQYLGGHYPQLQPESLADVEYISWPSRDGTRTIPGYLTVPHGEGPFPLIVLPHGGPFVSEVVTYDEWAQMLASRGYMVLQPQYRGSLGYGYEHYISALGQAGLAMQDDKDDGALYLVEQGRVDRDRIAMFGWSYGGYAALVAASRTPNIYQCVIAGAAVADPNLQLNYYRDQLIPAQEAFELSRREGIQPIDEVSNINVPMLIVHGSVDQRVPIEHMRHYIPELDRNGVNYQYLELEGADHFYNTLFYEHQIALYEKMTAYIESECGPGGL